MSNTLKLSLLALSVLVGMVGAFVFVMSRRQSQLQTEAMTLIRDMDGIDQQLSQASFEFGLALTQFLQNTAQSDPGAVRQSHHTLVESVNQSITVVSHLKPPESEHGAAFISAQRKFLLIQRRIIREDFGKLLGLIDDASIPPPQRADSIQAIVNAAFAETEKEFKSVHAARQKFANEFAIHLTVR